MGGAGTTERAHSPVVTVHWPGRQAEKTTAAVENPANLGSRVLGWMPSIGLTVQPFTRKARTSPGDGLSRSRSMTDLAGPAPFQSTQTSA